MYEEEKNRDKPIFPEEGRRKDLSQNTTEHYLISAYHEVILKYFSGSKNNAVGRLFFSFFFFFFQRVTISE